MCQMVVLGPKISTAQILEASLSEWYSVVLVLLRWMVWY